MSDRDRDRARGRASGRAENRSRSRSGDRRDSFSVYYQPFKNIKLSFLILYLGKKGHRNDDRRRDYDDRRRDDRGRDSPLDNRGYSVNK